MTLAFAAFGLAAAVAAAAPAAPSLDIREWPVPWKDTRPRDPFMDPSGRVWFVGQTGDYVAHLDPRTGEFKRFDLTKGSGPLLTPSRARPVMPSVPSSSTPTAE